MKIDKLEIKNFRCFDDISIEFDPHLNVFVGVNGSGKTAILSALRVAVGSFFLGFNQDIGKQVGIIDSDVRLVYFNSNFEPKLPVEIDTKGIVNGKLGQWKRVKDKQTKYAKTQYQQALFVKKQAEELAKRVVENKNGFQMPVIAYYSTERLNIDRKASFSIDVLGSRFRGYFNALELSSSRKVFEEWFRKQELARLQTIQRRENRPFHELELVRRCLVQCIPNCQDIYHDLTTEKIIMTFEDGSRQPFDNLSDGVLVMLTLISDIAFRCVLLNPSMGEKANLTEGVVLIDEIELHLHPSWQRRVIGDLRKVFPNIQFFITTHSPQVASTVPKDNLFILKDGDLEGQKIKTIERGLAFSEGRDSNSILADVFGIEKRPQGFARQLGDFYQYLEDENLEAAQLVFDNLSAKWGENDTDIFRASMFLSDLKRELTA
jgi:predicted ATP-binding protein involved in virulence